MINARLDCLARILLEIGSALLLLHFADKGNVLWMTLMGVNLIALASPRHND